MREEVGNRKYPEVIKKMKTFRLKMKKKQTLGSIWVVIAVSSKKLDILYKLTKSDEIQLIIQKIKKSTVL